MTPTVSSILAEVATERGVTVEQLLGYDRRLSVASARAEACLRLRERTMMSLPEIASVMRRESHSTVMSMCDRARADRARAEARREVA